MNFNTESEPLKLNFCFSFSCPFAVKSQRFANPFAAKAIMHILNILFIITKVPIGKFINCDEI